MISGILQQDAQTMYRTTEGLFRLVDDLAWQPATGKNWMNTAQLLHHCTNACGFPINGFAYGDWRLPSGISLTDIPPEEMLRPAEQMPAVESVDEAIQLLAADRDLCMDVLAGLDDERLLTQRSAAPWGGPELTLLQHCMAMIRHLGQHKYQLFYYLKLQGKDVNTMNLVAA